MSGGKFLDFALLLVAIIATFAVGFHLPEFKALDFFAILMVLLAGFLVGFALADGRPDKIAIEFIVAVGFIVIALLGMWKWTWLIPTGFVFHAAWCMVHHYTFLGARVRAWYAPLCALYSIMIAGFVYGRFFFS
ncbi:MAG: hypothetical protein PVG20_03450 [Thioalkalispiraceae bacterium]|jgi:hypothetical protein